MNKSELITALANKMESKKIDAEKFLKSFEEVITEELSKDGGKVSIVGFGTFDVLERAEHLGTLPGKAEKIMIPASKSPRFKAGKSLKDAVNGR